MMQEIDIENKIVRLNKYEMMMGALIGAQRQIESLVDGRVGAYGQSGKNQWEIHVQGALAEMAFAKFANEFWRGTVNTFSLPDCGKNVQIRWRSEPDYALIIRERDNDDHFYVLVTGSAPEFTIVGYIKGSAGKVNKDWIQTYGNRPPAYFVPQSALTKKFELAK